MTRRSAVRRPTGLIALVLATACSQAPVDTAHDLLVSNQTTIAVTLVVNGAVIRTVPPRTQEVVAPKDLPRKPWSVETRTSNGRLLSQMEVRDGDALETTIPGGGREMKGDAVRADLSCGRLDMWFGPPLAGPPPGPGRSGDCDP